MDYSLFIFPIVGGLIGYTTNYIAVKMLFRPHKPIGIGPLKIQGVLPKRRNDIATSIAATVEEELISIKDLTVILKNLDLGTEIDEMVDDFFRSSDYDGKSEILSKINVTINSYMRSKVKKSLNRNKDGLITEFIRRIEGEVDFKDIIETKIEGYDLNQLENIVMRVSSNELRYITIIGGVLGFMVGLVQMFIFIAM
ncbi:MAG: DUF445 family protein [Methanosarcinales archaeon]|nr:DUF445 family protein [ANME-2 cluster archaeon]MDF1530856.1 DUF445 family protein [ANME-2 cluster archaeon]MDW7776513.1 DUF445 family protein [Methanosarcinales archaeon]